MDSTLVMIDATPIMMLAEAVLPAPPGHALTAVYTLELHSHSLRRRVALLHGGTLELIAELVVASGAAHRVLEARAELTGRGIELTLRNPCVEELFAPILDNWYHTARERAHIYTILEQRLTCYLEARPSAAEAALLQPPIHGEAPPLHARRCCHATLSPRRIEVHSPQGTWRAALQPADPPRASVEAPGEGDWATLLREAAREWLFEARRYAQAYRETAYRLARVIELY